MNAVMKHEINVRRDMLNSASPIGSSGIFGRKLISESTRSVAKYFYSDEAPKE
jgi:hypothetical protein